MLAWNNNGLKNDDDEGNTENVLEFKYRVQY